MKKRLIKIVLVLMILVVSGCSNSTLGTSNIKKIDSKVDYVLFRNKKIYFTENLEDMVLQFKGLGCVFKKNYGNDLNIEIDKINSKDNEFYTLSGRDNMFDIECPIENMKYTMNTTIMFESASTEEEKNKYVDRKLGYWDIFSLDENVKVSIDKKILSLGDYNDNIVSSSKDVINILGNNYEIDRFSKDIVYQIDEYEYSFDVSTSSDKINGFSVQKK
jgi:hypothetical protein